MTQESNEKDVCQAQGWTHDDGEVTCDLPAGHEGAHVDSWEGWEWPSPRATSPVSTTERSSA